MMEAGFLDTITQTYVNALQQGFSTLYTYSLPLFGLLASIAWGATFIHTIQAGISLGNLLAHLVLVLLSLSIHIWVIANMQGIAFAFFNTFASWGASVAGGAFSAEQLLSPSTFLTLGFRISRPLMDFVLNMGGLALVRNIGPVIVALVAMLIIVGAFLWVTKDIIMSTIQFHFAVMLAPVLFPWAILSQTAELAALIVSWFLSSCLRVLVIIASVGIGAPLMQELVPLFTAGGDPTLASSLIMAGAALMFFLIVNEIVKLATIIGNRYGLGLAGAALIPSGARTAALNLVGGAAGAVVSGVSRTIQARRR